MDFALRLRELREEKKLTQEAIASLLNLTKANISKYELGKLQPNIETLKFLSNYFSVSIDYLLGITNIKEMGFNEFSKIPIIEIAKNTPSLFVAENIGGYELFDKPTAFSKDYFYFRMEDDSMCNARIFQDDLVCIHKQEHIENNEIALVKVDNMGILLRRVIKQEDQFILLPQNHRYSPLFLSAAAAKENSFTIIGKALYVKFYINE